MRESSASGELAPVAVVVLNWNGASDTLECLASLRNATVRVHAVVVDNGSAGDDVARIRASGLADTLLETGENLGYAEGNNVGLRHALDCGFEIVGVLNNDTLVDPGCFAVLAAQLEPASSSRKAIAPTIVYADDPARIWFAGGIVDRGWPRHLQSSELGTGESTLRASEWLTGCCIVARAETWLLVGLFDPRYFLIFEDSDWSLRARRHGVELQVAAQATIAHKVSRSFHAGPSSLLGSFYSTRNGLRFETTYARRHVARLILRDLVRPTLAQIERRRWERGLGFRWLGLVAFATAQRGRAPRIVAWLAARKTDA